LIIRQDAGIQFGGRRILLYAASGLKLEAGKQPGKSVE
jgi:hypothetical protein